MQDCVLRSLRPVSFALVAPKNTSPEIVATPNREVARILPAEDIGRRFGDAGGEISPMSPDELMAYVRAERAKWAVAVKASGTKMD
jgi:tripartite-type tricarboxylate transporter receptor subunit TctC